MLTGLIHILRLACFKPVSTTSLSITFQTNKIPKPKQFSLCFIRAVCHTRQTLRMAARDGQPLSDADVQRENLPPGKKARQEPKLLVKRLSEHAYLPSRGSAGAAGYDLARQGSAKRALLPKSI